MKQELNKRVLNFGFKIFSVLTIIFSILAILNIRNRLINVLAMSFFGVVTMLGGIREIAYEDKKKSGYLSIVISIIIFCVVFFTTYVSFKTSTF
jgi:hypothetical protein